MEVAVADFEFLCVERARSAGFLFFSRSSKVQGISTTWLITRGHKTGLVGSRRSQHRFQDILHNDVYTQVFAIMEVIICPPDSGKIRILSEGTRLAVDSYR